MVVRNGIGRYLYFPDTRICTESIRLPFWKYSAVSTGDIIWIAALALLLVILFSLFLREIRLCWLRIGVLHMRQGSALKVLEICMMCCIAVTIGPFDPSGRDHASDEFADVASDHRKPFYIRLQEDHFRKYCHRFLGMCIRARPFLSSECAFRGVYYSCPSPFLFDSESNKSGFKALKGEMKKGFYYIIALLIVSLFWSCSTKRIPSKPLLSRF